MNFSERTIQKEDIYKGKIINLELHTVELQNGSTSMREIIRHRGGVAVIALNKEKEIVLVKQFRKPYEQAILEIPAGKLEKGEKPEECAVRELKEETGLSAESLTLLNVMYPSPGYTDEKIYIFKAEGLAEGSICPDEDEFINVERYPLNKAVEMVKSGIINDAKTVIAIFMAAAEIK
ncbi:MAG: hydrolase [Clostridia bacterium]|jgi:ADP-ribose pyrophosphatase|nr:hydrolase [Clostridia bacterium]